MNITELQNRALEIREKYKKLEILREGKEWSTRDLAKGFLKDVQDLLKLIEEQGNKDKISHEMSDCFWSVLVLASIFDINLEQSYTENMNKLEERIDEELRVTT